MNPKPDRCPQCNLDTVRKYCCAYCGYYPTKEEKEDDRAKGDLRTYSSD